MTRTDTSNGALTRSAGVCRKRILLRDRPWSVRPADQTLALNGQRSSPRTLSRRSLRTRRSRPRLCRTRACFLRRGTCVRTSHTCARARPLGRTSASPRRSHPVGRGSRRRPPARPRPRAAWGTPARCRSRARLGLRIGSPIELTTRRRVSPQIRLIRPCSCGRAQDRSWKCLFAGILSQSFGPRDWATKGAAPSDETTQPAICRHFKKRERRDSNPRPPA
jgi:hypothetical protein